MRKVTTYFCCAFLSFSTEVNSQAVCDALTAANCDPWPASELILQNQQNSQAIDFTFESLSAYTAGITYHGSTMLRLVVGEASPSCVWKLKMHITNGGAPVPVNEWETLLTYGSGAGNTPELSLIQVRVTNACGSSLINGVWQTFVAADNAEITIIDDALGLVASGPPNGCSGSTTNGEGSYLVNPGEYMFSIDYRIIPGLDYSPGTYQMAIKFCLTE